MRPADEAGERRRLPDWHPLREQLYGELHTRPFAAVPTPARISHIAVLHAPPGSNDDLPHIAALCQRHGAVPPAPEAACFQQRLGALDLRWEQHLEFSTYTVIQPVTASGELFQQTALDGLPGDWLAGICGRIVCATHLVLADVEELTERDSARMSRYFEGHTLVTSLADHARARLWTAFRLHADQFGRLIVHNRGMSERRAGRLVQRLLEVETYRLMALLGLPMAKSLGPDIAQMDAELAVVTRQLAEIDDDDGDARALLDRLSRLSARIEAHRAHSNYRFAATRAYYDLVIQRLEELREEEIERHLSLTEFLTRRLTPAVRTCEAAGRRLEDLSKRIDRSSDLLRARINLTIESQNQSLLTSMERRARQQLQLQKTVEGMSIAAISFAAVGLLDIGLESLGTLGIGLNRAWVTALSIPLVVGLVWLAVRRIHRKVNLDAEDEST